MTKTPISSEQVERHSEVNGALLEEVTRRILSTGSPEKIVLFGSHARGDAHPGSDLDLLIIEASDLPRFRRAVPYLRALVGLFPAKDVVVWTPDEVQQWADIPDAFITTALQEGRILYERPERSGSRLVSESPK